MSKHRSAKLVLAFRFSYSTSTFISLLSHACYPSFHHANACKQACPSGEKHKLWIFSLRNFRQSFHFLPFNYRESPQHPLSNIPNLCSSLREASITTVANNRQNRPNERRGWVDRTHVSYSVRPELKFRPQDEHPCCIRSYMFRPWVAAILRDLRALSTYTAYLATYI